MSKRTHLRNAAFAVFTIAVIFTFLIWQVPASAAPPQAPARQGTDFRWGTAQAAVTVQPGQVATFNSVLRNDGTSGTFDIRVLNLPTGWTFGASPGTDDVAVPGGTNNFQFSVRIFVPANASAGVVNLTVRALKDGTDPQPFADAFFDVTVVIPTPTNTASPAPPSATPTRGPVCSDRFEADNNPASARRIDVATSQEHTICPTGDEDWLYFGGIAGKVYTIDITRMDPGIDLSLELFDSNLNSIAFNDDFYNRDPNNPNPGDIRPRITIRIPAEGTYYIRVRDNAGRGGTNYFYVIALIDESYGPTPTLVREICLDLFEPDGLPEQARLITSNELQEERRLCPSGDADWVIFFAKTGKRYVIFTDTRRYRGRNEVNGDTQAGADTVMVLTDRDGVSLIDVNDDIPGGNTFDSQIEFIPEVDGFYFIQIKNVGDIGNQFIRYDLTLLLCLPEQTDCGRAGEAPSPGTPPPNPATLTPVGTPANEFVLDPTLTPRPSATATPNP